MAKSEWIFYSQFNSKVIQTSDLTSRPDIGYVDFILRLSDTAIVSVKLVQVQSDCKLGWRRPQVSLCVLLYHVVSCCNDASSTSYSWKSNFILIYIGYFLDQLELNKKPLSTEEIIQFAAEILAAVSNLHKRTPPKLHGSLRPDSVIVTPDRNSVAIWLYCDTDAGLVNWYERRATRFFENGSYHIHPNWLNKILMRKGQTSSMLMAQSGHCAMEQSMDLWSLGCLVVYMYTNGCDPVFRYVDNNNINLDISPGLKPTQSLINKAIFETPTSSDNVISGLCRSCFRQNVGGQKAVMTAQALREYLDVLLQLRDTERESFSSRPFEHKSGLLTWSDGKSSVGFKWNTNVGCGGAGVVYKVEITKSNNADVLSGTVQALKVFASLKFDATRRDALMQLKHENIVKLMAIGNVAVGPDGFVNTTMSQSGILMTFCEGTVSILIIEIYCIMRKTRQCPVQDVRVVSKHPKRITTNSAKVLKL